MTNQIIGLIMQGEYPACEVLETSYYHKDNESPIEVAIRYYGYHRAQMRDYLAIMFTTSGSAVVYSRSEILAAAHKMDSGVDSEENRATEEPTQVVGEVVPEAGIEPATKGL